MASTVRCLRTFCARVCASGHVNQHWSSECVHDVAETAIFKGFFRQGCAWRWVWVALRATTSLHCRHDHVFFARATCHVRVHASCNQVRPDARAACRRGWDMDQAFQREGSTDRRSHVTPTGTAFCIHGRDGGSCPHVQRARVTVHVNAGVHRIFGGHLAKRKKLTGARNLAFEIMTFNFSTKTRGIRTVMKFSLSQFYCTVQRTGP